MNWEVHVPFWERLTGKFRRSTHHQLHWVLDVAFDEDRCRAREGFAAENLAVARQVTLNLLKMETSVKAGIKNKRKTCGWSEDYMMKVLGLVDSWSCFCPGIVTALYLTKRGIAHRFTKKTLLKLSSYSFFVFAVHEPILTALRKLVYKVVQPSSDASIMVLYFSIPTVILIFSVATYKLLDKSMPRALSLVSGGK